MTVFGIKLLDEIDLPEFPFPDLGQSADGEEMAAKAHRPPRRRPKHGQAGRESRWRRWHQH